MRLCFKEKRNNNNNNKFGALMVTFKFGNILQILATRIAQLIPPKNPTILPVTHRFFDHNLIMRRASMNYLINFIILDFILIN